MTWTIIVTLILAGLLFLVLEILVFPGATVVGVVGFILIIIGVYASYNTYGVTYGHYTLAACFGLTFVTLFFSLRSKTWNKLMLKDELHGRVNTFDVDAIKVGDLGKTVSRLVPIGNALINDEIYEVAAKGEFIDQEKEIVIIKINNNKIYVKLKTD